MGHTLASSMGQGSSWPRTVSLAVLVSFPSPPFHVNPPFQTSVSMNVFMGWEIDLVGHDNLLKSKESRMN